MPADRETKNQQRQKYKLLGSSNKMLSGTLRVSTYLKTAEISSHFILHHVFAVNMDRLEQCVSFDDPWWCPATSINRSVKTCSYNTVKSQANHRDTSTCTGV